MSCGKSVREATEIVWYKAQKENLEGMIAFLSLPDGNSKAESGYSIANDGTLTVSRAEFDAKYVCSKILSDGGETKSNIFLDVLDHKGRYNFWLMRVRVYTELYVTSIALYYYVL